MSEPIRCSRASHGAAVVVEAEAVQWDGSYADQGRIVTWGVPHITGWFDGTYFLDVTHRGRTRRCEPSDWIIRDRGGYSVLSDREFHALYDVEPTP